MRSRDGYYSFILRLCTIILSFSILLDADEYLVSYRYVVKNAILYNESLDISKSMTKCEGIPSQTLILASLNKHNFQKIIDKHKDKFIEYIQKLGINVESRERTTNSQIHSTTIITLKTTCFKVDFNDNFVKISHLKQP